MVKSSDLKGSGILFTGRIEKYCCHAQ